MFVKIIIAWEFKKSFLVYQYHIGGGGINNPTKMKKIKYGLTGRKENALIITNT